MVSSPSKENRSSQPQLGLPSCLPCWFRVPSCPDLFCVLVCYKREMMLQLPRGSLAPSFCPLVHLDRSCSGLESTWCSRSRKAIPAISWDIPLLLHHHKSTGKGEAIWVFIVHYTCHALGKRVYKAKHKQRFSCLRGGEGLALFCSCC